MSFILVSFSSFLIAFASAPFGNAGDAAYPEALGFSPRGDRFAFAEWGREDGSGFSYANVYVVDLVKDSWLSSPTRVVVEDERASPAAAYGQALAEASEVLRQFEISMPARLVHARSFHQNSANEGLIRWSRFGTIHAHMTTAEFRLEVFKAPSNCLDQAYIFALLWDGATVYRDDRLSPSRGCPVDYSVERIYIDDQNPEPRFAVALIGVYRQGFEGLDLRHIGVPIPLKQD